MRVVCIADTTNDIFYTKGLTFGKCYEVIPSRAIDKNYLSVINDFKCRWSYRSEFFKKLEDLREDKLNELGI